VASSFSTFSLRKSKAQETGELYEKLRALKSDMSEARKDLELLAEELAQGETLDLPKTRNCHKASERGQECDGKASGRRATLMASPETRLG
jgi:hypothetical protein